MKIVLFTESLTSGGAEKQITELAKGLNESGEEVVVSFYRQYYHYKNELLKHGIAIHEFTKGGRFDLGLVLNLAKYIKSIKPDFIISYKTNPNIFLLLAAKLTSYKNIIISERNTDLDLKRSTILAERLLCNNAKYVVANSYTMAKMLKDEMKFPNDKVKTIHNGIDVREFGHIEQDQIASLKVELGIKSQDFNLCLVGRIAKQKNHELLINAIYALANRSPMTERKIRAYFVGNIGDQALFERLQLLIESLNLKDYIVFLNATENIKRIYYAMDAVVLPSIYEGFPNVIIEAMCCSRVVLASDVSDNRYIIKDGVNGYLFENNNLPMLVHKLENIISMDEQERKIMGEIASQTVTQGFSTQNMVQKDRELIYS